MFVLWADLFYMFLDHVLSEALDAYQGGTLVNGRRVSNLRFAIDIDLMGETVTEVQDILTAVKSKAWAWNQQRKNQGTVGL